MKKLSRLWGGVLLIAGTSIGAGMLALPVSTGMGGFFPSLGLFLLVWGLMFFSAHVFLDVSLSFKGEPNLLSMTRRLLGKGAEVVVLLVYLILLYSLLAAYLAACTPLFSSAFFFLFHTPLPPTIAPFILPLLFTIFLCIGTTSIDYFNRLLMLGLFLSYCLLIGTAPCSIQKELLLRMDLWQSSFALPIIMTSFGYHVIIPSLATYMDHDKKALRKILWMGSLIPLAIYILWQALVLGVVPPALLHQAQQLGLAATEPLAAMIQSRWLGPVSHFFSFFAIITSFLGISLSLLDFFRDGIKSKNPHIGKALAIALAFLPPLIFVFFYKEGFYMALEYAGICVAILFGIIPGCMALRLPKSSWYQTITGRILAWSVISIFLAIAVFDLIEKGR